MNYKEILENVYQKIAPIENKGELATYIPELATIDSEKFGVHISTVTNTNFGLGKYQEKYSIQRNAKI